MASPLVHTQRIPEGTVLEGRYEITGFIGAGGFAQVYRGRQLAIKRDVAIKILYTRESDDQQAFEERFLREAQTAAQIRHPNVVTIYDYGVTGHRPYIVMELLEGHDLNAELKRDESMNPSRAVNLMIDCLDALGVGHKQGIVHKDLKPANLYITDPGTRRERLKILDFGIARLQDGSAHLTTTGQLMGTPKYYAPEYIKTQTVSPALDVYQMGLILVEMFMRRPVVDMDDPYLCLMKHSMGDLGIPQSLLGGPLGPVLSEALALEPAQRFHDAHAFRDALEGVYVAKITPVKRDEPRQRLSETSGNHHSPVLSPHPPHQTGPTHLHHTGSTAQPSLDGVKRIEFDAPQGTTDSGKARISVAAKVRSSGTSQLMDAPDQLSASSGPLKKSEPPNARAATSKPRRAAKAPSQDDVSPTAALVLIGVLVVLMLGGGGLLATYAIYNTEAPSGDPQESAESPAEGDDTEPDNAEPDKDEVLADEAAAGQDAPQEVDFVMADAEPVSVRLEITPSYAKVYLDDKPLGTSPVTHTFNSDTADPVTLVIEAVGYKDQKLRLRPSDEPVVTLQLAREPNQVQAPVARDTPPPARETQATAPKKPDAQQAQGNSPSPKAKTNALNKGGQSDKKGGGGFLMPPVE